MKITKESFVTDLDDCISRKQALKDLSNLMDINGFRDGYAVSKSNVEFMLKSLPVVYPRRSIGSWIYDANGMDWGLGAWVCSECKQKNDMLPTYIQMVGGKNITHDKINPLNWAGSKYCPNCGCKMIGFKNDNIAFVDIE